jgi:hypothetical protein
MATYRGRKKLAHFNKHLMTSLSEFDKAYRGFYIRVRENATDEEVDVYMNYTTGFIDDDSLIDDGVTTISEWKTAMGATNLYIVTWYNVGGLKIHLTNGDTIRQPELVLNGSGNRARMLYTSSFLRSSSFSTFYSPATIFLVYQQNGNQSGNQTLFAGSQLFASDCWAFRNRSLVMALHFHNSLNENRQNLIEPSQNNNLNVISAVFDGISRKAFYLNGNLISDGQQDGGFKGLFSEYSVGRAISGFLEYYQGYIESVIAIREELSDADREQIEREIISH